MDRRTFLSGLAALAASFALPSAASASDATDWKSRFVAMRRSRDKWRLKLLAKKKVWNKDDVEFVVRKVARDRKMSKAKTNRAVQAALDIIFTGEHPHIKDKHEAKESSGDTHCGIKKSRKKYKGILQFHNKSWKLNAYEKKLWKAYDKKNHPKNWRYSGIVSVARFVRCYDIGGEAALRRAWGQTLGR